MKYDYIFLFNNIEKPFLKIFFKDENNIVSNVVINFTEIENGVFTIADIVKEAIKRKLETEGKRVLLLLNCDEIYTNIISYPSLNLRKSKKIYDSQFAEEYPSPNAQLIKFEYETDNGSAYLCHFVPNHLLEFFGLFFKDLGFATYHYELYGKYLSDKYNQLIKNNNYLLFFDDGLIVNASLVYEGEMIYSKSFIDKPAGYNRSILTLVDSFNNKIGKKKINRIISNNEIPSLLDDSYEIIESDIDLTDYEGCKF